MRMSAILAYFQPDSFLPRMARKWAVCAMRCQSVDCEIMCSGSLIVVVRNGAFGLAKQAFL